MYQGYYILDTFRYQSHDEEDAKDQVVSHSFSLSKVNSLKGICSSKRKTHILEQLQEAYDSLSTMVLDVEGLVVFLTSYPRLYRQPYSMHIHLGNCMFGRQMEAELVLNFLFHTPPNGPEALSVLPIVGPGRVGKSTLVAHVCKDERVRNYFSEILFLSDHDFRDEKLTYLREACAKKYQNCALNKDGRMLIVVEVAVDFNDGEWKMLYSIFIQCMTSDSRIIITSRSRAVTLKSLSYEAYRYFLKTLTFGSMDPIMKDRNVQPQGVNGSPPRHCPKYYSSNRQDDTSQLVTRSP
ncbi:hypothetical protein BAE44_0024595 [Dichanthelium oligosanthes]|uniref:NB-ARC domain-containing protein n=1 Tax=Dichanthelium oligosanthes TaxID=888268 RepID=A0A1E5UNF2_9POAL|nr:hypothetical protein BAE44_0024595 [Dichanthelium oligosanthes]